MFADLPLVPGFVTGEFGYHYLDPDDATQLVTGAAGLPTMNARQTQGDGWYAQLSYFFESWNLQP